MKNNAKVETCMVNDNHQPNSDSRQSKSRPDIGYAEKAELLFQRFLRHGQRWKARELERDTEKEVSAAYVSALLKGKMQRPGDEMQTRIADAMGFPSSLWELPPEEWDTELEWVRREALRSRNEAGIGTLQHSSELDESQTDVLPKDGLGGRELADLLNYLFERLLNKRTGKRYTEQQVAIYTEGVLSTQEIRKMRSGESLRVGKTKLRALSDAFEIPPDYWRSMSRRDAHLAGIQQIRRYIERGEITGTAGRNLESKVPKEEGGISQGDRNAMVKLLEYLGFVAYEEPKKGDKSDNGV